MARAVNFTFSASSQTLVDDFKAACRKRGRKYSYVLSGAMRYYVAHPQASGWGNGESEVQKPKQKKIAEK